MKKTFTNATHIEGYIYEHKLEEKVSGETSKNPGTPFISGTLSIATDDELLNVVQVHFTYVTAVTSKGKPNNTYNTLKAIIDGKIQNVMEHGKENAGMVRIDSAIGLNEWYDSRNNDQLVSVRRNEGGFVHQINELNENPEQRATFDVDILITKATRLEPDEERELPERMIIRGAAFDFRKALLPIELTVKHPGAMDYFDSMEISNTNPLFTELKGIQVSRTVVRRKEEAGAWGEVSVTETRSSERDFVVNWAKPAPYEWDDEATLTAKELEEMMAAREIYLADIKKRQDEYQATKGNALAGGAVKSAPVPASGTNKTYDF